MPTGVVDACTAMALEEVIMSSVTSGGPPTVRLWTWDRDAVTVGRFQCVEDEVDMSALRGAGCQLTRRMSGGGAMFHGRGAEVVFSVTCPEEMIGGGIRASYGFACALVVRALRLLGLASRVGGVNSVLVDDRKVSGNAQRRSRGVVQHHGTLLVTVDEAKMSRALLAGRAPPSVRGTPSRPFAVTGVGDLYGLKFNDVAFALESSLLAGRPWRRSRFTGAELRTARELAASRYASPGWTLSR